MNTTLASNLFASQTSSQKAESAKREAAQKAYMAWVYSPEGQSAKGNLALCEAKYKEITAA